MKRQGIRVYRCKIDSPQVKRIKSYEPKVDPIGKIFNFDEVCKQFLNCIHYLNFNMDKKQLVIYFKNNVKLEKGIKRIDRRVTFKVKRPTLFNLKKIQITDFQDFESDVHFDKCVER